MSGSLNRASLIGNLGSDPEVRTMQNGGRGVTLSVATSESWKDDSTGERRERTEWHRVVIFNDGLGKIAEQYLTKGAKVFVDPDSWLLLNGAEMDFVSDVSGAGFIFSNPNAAATCGCGKSFC